MTLAQHPATEALSANLPSEVCRIVCEFAAPHAAPTITTVYQLIRTSQKEELAIFAARWQVPCNSIQHIVEFSPNSEAAEARGGSCREIRVSSSWTRERERYGLAANMNRCLCQRLGGPINKVLYSCVWLLGEDHHDGPGLSFGQKAGRTRERGAVPLYVRTDIPKSPK